MLGVDLDADQRGLVQSDVEVMPLLFGEVHGAVLPGTGPAPPGRSGPIGERALER